MLIYEMQNVSLEYDSNKIVFCQLICSGRLKEKGAVCRILKKKWIPKIIIKCSFRIADLPEIKKIQVIHTLLRDSFNTRISQEMDISGFYCLFILRKSQDY